jgi:hypothetical protein
VTGNPNGASAKALDQVVAVLGFHVDPYAGWQVREIDEFSGCHIRFLLWNEQVGRHAYICAVSP